MRRCVRGWLAMVALLPLTGCGGEGARNVVAIGNPAPAFGAPTLAGDTMTLASLRGEVVLLNLWATWCPPCREEMPALEALHRQHGAEGLRVLGVSIDEASDRAEIEEFLRQNDITFTVLHDTEQRVTGVFRTTGVPETFLIGRDGTLKQRWIGKIEPGSESVAGAVRAALAEEAN